MQKGNFRHGSRTQTLPAPDARMSTQMLLRSKRPEPLREKDARRSADASGSIARRK